jgi:nicotinamidase-related amidase
MAEPRVAWEPFRSAVIIVDMWDLNGLGHCRSATGRAEELAPPINRTVAALRQEGAFIIHAPSDCMDAYREYPARTCALHAPHHAAPETFEWNWPDAAREPLVPELILSWGDWVDRSDRCSCEPGSPSCITEAPRPWTRQNLAIEVRPEDALTDVGQEVFNLLEERDIQDVLLMGVHANVCVLSRDFGIRQLVRLGKRPILCRDLTDSFHRHPAGHSVGNRVVVEHIERYWCPTVTSAELVGGEPFRFSDDR